MDMQPEVWQRGPIPDVPAALMPAAHALLQTLEDAERAAADLTLDELWATPGGAASVGFHLLHLAGSTDRLLTYARGERLSSPQRAALTREQTLARVAAVVLLDELRRGIEDAVAQLRASDPATLHEGRTIGRAALPTTVLGLLFHAAEHAQRHAGQIVTTAKIVRGLATALAPDRTAVDDQARSPDALVDSARDRPLSDQPAASESAPTPLTEDGRGRLGELRARLLDLHKVLLDDTRAAYELDRGRVGSNANLLQLVINDPWFAWLREISERVVRIDEIGEDPRATTSDAHVVVNQVERLLTASETGEGFARRYYEALQRQPAVVLAHADVRRTIKSMR